MGEEKGVLKQVVKHKGFFNYSELYNFCYNWFKNEGFLLVEKEYVEKLGSGGKEVTIKWSAFRKVTDYYQNFIDVNWHILGMSDAEVEENGKKVKTNKGEVKLTIDAKLKKDWEETWDKQPFYKFLRGIYDRYIMRTTEDEYEVRLIEKTEEFVEDTKAFLNLEGKR
jgi:hypothetical protein